MVDFEDHDDLSNEEFIGIFEKRNFDNEILAFAERDVLVKINNLT